MKKLMLIDGHSIINRAFYALPEMTNSKGVHTNAVLGFLNIMFRFLDEEKPTHFAVAFDLKAPTFRHKMFKEYKGTRKPMPKELHEQVAVVQDVLRAMDIPLVMQEGYEADDLLGTMSVLAEKEGYEVRIISGDRDLLQLATKHVCIRIPKTKQGSNVVEDYFSDDVIKEYEVTPTEFIDLKGLMGDTADNIPGIPGIGKKTASNLIKEFKSIENAYEHLEEVKPPRAKNNLKEYYDQGLLSKELATIKLDCPMEFSFEDAKADDIFTQKAYESVKELELKSILKKFDQTDSPALELNISVTDQMDEIEEAFAEAASLKETGLAVYENEDNLWAAVCTGEKTVVIAATGGFTTQEFILKEIGILYKEAATVCTMEIKDYLGKIGLDESCESIFDVELAAYLINPLKSTYDYDDIARDYLGELLPSEKELLDKKKPMADESGITQEGKTLLGYRSYIAMAGAPILRAELKETNMDQLYKDIEIPTLFTLHDMEQRGIHVDKEALKTYGDQLVGRIGELEQLIYKEAGEKFNILSPKQLGVILFEKMVLPGGKKTKTGYSTSVEVLEDLEQEYPIVAYVLEYRQLSKLKSTYADGLANFIGADQRIHGKFHQTITATGRISSTDPNLQNIPARLELGRAIRKVFLPKEGCIFVDADYSQIELRVLAHLSEDKNLIQAYMENQDIHTKTASEVFGVPMDQVTSVQRRDAKAVNFGIVYGLSAFGLSKDIKVSRAQAQEYIDKYFATYPQVKEYLDRQVEQGKQDGYVETMFHRRRPIPELKSSNFMQRNFGERVAMNSPIQGSAADIIKIAMNRVNMRLKNSNLHSRLILQIHDELLIEADPDEEEQVKEILTEEMMHVAALAIPLSIDISSGHNWYEAK